MDLPEGFAGQRLSSPIAFLKSDYLVPMELTSDGVNIPSFKPLSSDALSTFICKVVLPWGEW